MCARVGIRIHNWYEAEPTTSFYEGMRSTANLLVFLFAKNVVHKGGLASTKEASDNRDRQFLRVRPLWFFILLKINRIWHELQ